MLCFSRKPWYTSIEEYDEELKVGSNAPVHRCSVSRNISWIVALAFISGLSLAGSGLYAAEHFSNAKTSTTNPTVMGCTSPTVRREWRTLTSEAKDSYISAVKCLATRPAQVANGTAYDDFPFVHKETAPSAHMSAPFLPWHRYYIHSYEATLKRECGYSGVLPYWDWSADSKDFSNAPVWSADAFGGNGVGAETVGEGACVADGPFSNLEARYYDDQEQPHCLSRGWQSGEALKELANLIDPAALEGLLEEPDFSNFASELENRAHTFISRSVRGDFSKYTGPYDPVFFLHHTNLDRIWAEWQAKHTPTAYSGRAHSLTSESASLYDTLSIAGLLPDVQVADVMSTTSDLFCYTY